VNAWEDATRGLLELFALLRTTGIRSLLSAALREAAYVLHSYGDDDTAVAATLARSELPDIQRRSDDLQALREELEVVQGERWPSLVMQARIRSADDVLELCVRALERVGAST
jgi:hypothetical protein